MKYKLLTTLALACTLAGQAQTRQEIELQDDWQFSHDKQTWETVSVPHDWAISGPFDKKWDLQKVAIVQNGETEATEKSGRSGALPWIGEGHYKRIFTIPAGFSGHAELLFDGAMAEPTVYVNGEKAGYWAYGYNTFRLDISQLVKAGDNLLEVDLKNLEESSRWYPGAGIYRPVTLVLTSADWIDPWKTFIRTQQIAEGEAVLDVTVGSGSPLDLGLGFIVEICDAEGRTVAQGYSNEVNNFGESDMTIRVPNPKLWSPEKPYLYTARIKYMQDNQLLDTTTQKFGIRTVKCSKDGGFQLNGVTRKLKGVCLHHDLGPLGAAINKAALIRQIKTMKDMGCDAIRTSHNMPSQWQMDICDSLGMMVMAESFDMWIYPKCKNGYSRFFKEWAERDLTNLVLANRNHPCIVMWSIGNEIPEQGSKQGREISEQLQEICHSLDPTRTVTQGLDRAEEALKSGVAQMMDVPGFNYRVQKYKKNLEQLPQGFLLGSETASTVSSRGVYKFPVKIDDNARFSSWAKGYDPKAIETADGQCSSYDVEYCPWSNLPDDDWRWQDDYDWVIGEFVWTGYDYLGEPSPYDEYWPSRSSYFGICDLAGLPKDRYFLYRSHWNKEAHTIHLLPHWTWGKERIGEVTPVYCYTDYDEAELFVNGKSQGKKTHLRPLPSGRGVAGAETSQGQESLPSRGDLEGSSRLDRYRLRWNDVKYEPGEVKVVVYDADGKPAGEKVMKTAGQPSQLQAEVWTQNNQHTLKADGNDLAFVTVSLADKDGTFIPDATDQLTFEVSGAGVFRAVCNGDATSLESFTQPTMKLFAGQLVVVVQAGKEEGQLTLTVKDKQRKLTKEIYIPVN